MTPEESYSNHIRTQVTFNDEGDVFTDALIWDSRLEYYHHYWLTGNIGFTKSPFLFSLNHSSLRSERILLTGELIATQNGSLISLRNTQIIDDLEALVLSQNVDLDFRLHDYWVYIQGSFKRLGEDNPEKEGRNLRQWMEKDAHRLTEELNSLIRRLIDEN
jgi:hypothetical protein